MRKRFLYVLLAYLAAVNPALSDETNSKIDTLLATTEVDNSIQRLERKIRTDLSEEDLTRPEQALSTSEKDLYLEKLSEAILTSRVKDYLVKALSEEEISQLIDFYQQPLARKLTVLDRPYEKPEQLKSQYDFFNFLDQHIPPKARIQLINQVEEASLTTESQLYLKANVFQERAKAKLIYFDKYDDENKQKLEYQISSFKDTVEHNLRNANRLDLQFRYRELSDEELQQILVLHQNPLRRKFVMALTEAITLAMRAGVNTGITNVLRLRNDPKS
ncbi:MAG: hypothetical protein OEZ43_04155 [Gammaproteobacteria bacterium]|nr:hypothetical protein [Gammaproteobacteria bacterium]